MECVAQPGDTILLQTNASILPLSWRMVIPWKNNKIRFDRGPFYILKPAELLPGRYDYVFNKLWCWQD